MTRDLLWWDRQSLQTDTLTTDLYHSHPFVEFKWSLLRDVSADTVALKKENSQVVFVGGGLDDK